MPNALLVMSAYGPHEKCGDVRSTVANGGKAEVLSTFENDADDPDRKTRLQAMPVQALTRLSDIGGEVRLVEKQTARNGPGAVARISGGIDDSNVGPCFTKRFRDIPTAAVAIQANIGEQKVDRRFGLGNCDGLFGVASLQNTPA
jgi:hypothetical protein